MNLLLAIEASKADGTTFRVFFGWKFPPLASWLSSIGLLF